MSPKRIEIDMRELERIVEKAQSEPLTEQEVGKLKAALETLLYVTQALETKGTSIERLRRLLFGASTEKMNKVLGKEKDESPGGAGAGVRGAEEKAPEDAPKGHGRNGAGSYSGAEKIEIAHDSLKPGDRCPKCKKGKLYRMEPSVLVRVVGRAPIQARILERERLRCNPCGEVFTAKLPEGVGAEKYDASAAAMIGLLKYGSGLPFNRLEGLERSFGIPLPASTQWDIVSSAAPVLGLVHEELIRQAAQGEVVYNDDTTAKILDRMGARRESCDKDSEERTGIFTSGIVSTADGRRIALFFTGGQHAGENLAEVLSRRASKLAPPIQMCDALSRNMSEDLRTIVSNCLAHGRRSFVDVVGKFPDECEYVLRILSEVYRHDEVARERKLSKEERLAYHKAQSGSLMEGLMSWMREQFDQKKVEPNSGLGKAIQYMINHWEKLTRFLQVAGAPLDNNLCERALKKAILHRKNSLFYKTDNGAHVGDIFMSLIHTAELTRVPAFDYLVEILRNRSAVEKSPGAWMPWNYRETLDRLRAKRSPVI